MSEAPKLEDFTAKYAETIEKEVAALDSTLNENGEALSKVQKKNREKNIRASYSKIAKEEFRAAQVAFSEKEKLMKAKNIQLVLKDAPFDAIKIRDINDYTGKRVQIRGWVHRVRKQGSLLFLIIRDGSENYVQVVLEGDLAKCYDALMLYREATVEVYGEVRADERAVGGFEIKADFWKTLGASKATIEELVQPDSGLEQSLDNRHIVLRGERASGIQRVRAWLLQEIRNFYANSEVLEVSPPMLVQTMCEGGATLFKLDYYGEEAFLTQSSQLYIETMCPSLGDVFCICPSFRAEKSFTRRHLSEFVHVEAEYSWLDFNGLLDRIEDLLCTVTEQLALKHKEFIEKIRGLAPEEIYENKAAIPVLKRGFKRMTYAEAIEWLIQNGVTKEDGTPFQYGDEINEAPERKMVDTIGCPIMLIKFPAEQKSFYMAPCDEGLTESVDVLIPGVGEIVGGSMRKWSEEDILAAFDKEGIDPKNYYWYVDLRRYGGFPHGGYGLGLSRFLCWLCNVYNIRDVEMYPRTPGRCTP